MTRIATAITRTLALLFTALALTSGALAQGEPKKSPFGMPVTQEQGAAGTPAQVTEPGVLQRAWMWVVATQHSLHRAMAAAVRDMKNGSVLSATITLALISFAYGVLHAAGPGHGKAIISSYVLANERTVRRGIMLSFLSALIQALSAIVIVGVLAVALNATSLEIKSTEAWIETVSWGLVALIGAWLVYRQITSILAQRSAAATEAHAHSHTHVHDHSHAHAEAHSHATGAAHAEAHSHAHAHAHGSGCCGHHGHAHPPAKTHNHAHHDHSHQDHAHDHHAHEHGACCDHAHMPDPKELEGDLPWTKALAIAFSVGIRPCTGAILVMIFALSQGILIAGIFATFAMALGTAITVSALAALAVGSRELALRYAGDDAGWTTTIANGAGLLGSGLVLLLGATLFVASLTNPPVPF